MADTSACSTITVQYRRRMPGKALHRDRVRSLAPLAAPSAPEVVTPPATSAGSDSAARVYTHLRTAHLERFRHMAPAQVLYVERRYDFDESLIDPANPPVQRSRLGV